MECQACATPDMFGTLHQSQVLWAVPNELEHAEGGVKDCVPREVPDIRQPSTAWLFQSV